MSLILKLESKTPSTIIFFPFKLKLIESGSTSSTRSIISKYNTSAEVIILFSLILDSFIVIVHPIPQP